MEFLILVAGLILFLIWFVNGMLNSRRREIEQELDEYEEAMRGNAKADRARKGSDLDRRVRNKYSRR
jgi:F0F1-type ATP synthase membrane subunit b/b'